MGQAELTGYAAGMYKRVNQFWSDHKSQVFGSLPLPLGSELKQFCLHELGGYVELSQPHLIWVFGMATSREHLSDAATALADEAGKRCIILKGEVFGCPAYGSLHPSGAGMHDDWNRMTAAMRELLG